MKSPLCQQIVVSPLSHLRGLQGNRQPHPGKVSDNLERVRKIGFGNPRWFRVLTIEDSKIISNVVLQYGDNKTLTPLMTLDYAAANDGTASSNRATITNDFDMAFPECKVRFAMKPGDYSVTGGKIEQIIKADKASVYDVRIPVAAKAKAVVTIQRR